jgi:hypothetical protein
MELKIKIVFLLKRAVSGAPCSQSVTHVLPLGRRSRRLIAVYPCAGGAQPEGNMLVLLIAFALSLEIVGALYVFIPSRGRCKAAMTSRWTPDPFSVIGSCDRKGRDRSMIIIDMTIIF